MDNTPHTVLQPTVCYLTASYAPDIERFALLRHSITLFSPHIDHVVYVDPEDVSVFQRRFAADRGLTVLSKRDVLSPQMERARKLWRFFRKFFVERVGWRVYLDVTYSGWKLQQIVKLCAGPRLPYDAIIFVDSDDFLCGPVSVSDYFHHDDLVLLETPAETYEDFVFDSFRQLLVGGAFLERAACFNYIHTPPRFLRRTAERTLAHLQSTHINWEREFMSTPLPSEYNLLGWTARSIEKHAGYRHHPAPPEDWAYVVKDLAKLDAMLETCRAEKGRRKFFLIQSNMKDSSYIPRARALIEELARQR